MYILNAEGLGYHAPFAREPVVNTQPTPVSSQRGPGDKSTPVKQYFIALVSLHTLYIEYITYSIYTCRNLDIYIVDYMYTLSL